MASNSSEPGGLGGSQVEYVEINEDVPIPPGAGADELLGVFRLILGMGLVQRVEFVHGRPTAYVTRLVRPDQVPQGLQTPPEPLAEGGEFRLDLDLYALVRSGEVGFEELDVDYDSKPLDVIGRVAEALLSRKLHPTYILSGDRERFLAWLELPTTYQEDRVRGMVVEYNGNIPSDTFLMYGGPAEGGPKDQLMLAMKVVYATPEMSHELQADRGDDSQGTGTDGDVGGAGEQGEPAPTSTPPPFLGPSPAGQ